MQAMATAIGVDDEEHWTFLWHFGKIRNVICDFAVESWLEELPGFVNNLESCLWKYGVVVILCTTTKIRENV